VKYAMVHGILDRPLEPVIGRRNAPTRWRTMTVVPANPPQLIATKRPSRLPQCPCIRYGCGAFLFDDKAI
jgi:hypothetical protein